MDHSQTGLPTLHRYGRLIVAGASLSMLVALVVSWTSPKTYRATTYVMISESKVNPDVSRPDWDYAFLPTYIQFVNNDALASEAVKRFHLDKEPYNLTPHRFLQQSVDTQVVKNTRLLEIDVDFRDARLAADLANYLANGAAELNVQINDVDTVNTQKFLKARLDQASARLAEARAQSLDVERRAHIEDRERQLKILLDQKELVSRQVEDLRSALAQDKQRSTSLAESLIAEPRTVKLDKSIVSDRFLEHAAETLAPDNQGLLSATEEAVNPTRQELDRELANSRASVAADQAGLNLAATTLAEINTDAGNLAAELAQLRSAIDETEENVKLAREGYESATRDYRNASVTVTARSQDLKPVSPAIIPERPIRPRILLNTIAAGILGLVVCAALALGIDGARRAEPERLRVVEREAAGGRYS
jgi:protein tyrosine kinase modulator